MKKQKPEEKALNNLPETNKEEIKNHEKVSSSDENSDDENISNSNIKNSKDTEEFKAFSDAESFSDTFDILSENGDANSKVPNEIPLFVDLEPVHFTKVN